MCCIANINALKTHPTDAADKVRDLLEDHAEVYDDLHPPDVRGVARDDHRVSGAVFQLQLLVLPVSEPDPRSDFPPRRGMATRHMLLC